MIFNYWRRFNAAFGIMPNADFRNVDLKVSNFEGDENDFERVILYRGNEQFVFGSTNLSDGVQDILSFPPFLSFTRRKKLIITPVDNTDIEVVERYSKEPYDIAWKSLLVDTENHNFPKNKMTKLHEIFEYDCIWNVSSDIMNAIGIEAIYIKDINLSFIEGYEDTVAVDMSLRAIKPLEYTLKQ